MSDRDRRVNQGQDPIVEPGTVVEETVIERDVVVDRAPVVGRDRVVVDQGTVAASNDPLARAAAEGPLPSMSTDNTPEGQQATDPTEPGPIASVVEDMRVVDAAGDEIGKVRAVRMGDPAAATTRGEDDTESNTLWDDIVTGIFGDNSDVPPSARHELVRTGFIEIDGKGWFGADYAVPAAQIASVSGDTVRLSVSKDALLRV